MTRRDVDQAVDTLGARQHGAFNWLQFRAVGGTKGMAKRRLLSGHWLEPLHLVFALASHPATWERQLKIVELGCPGAVIAGRSAATLHGLKGFRPGRPNVIIPHGTSYQCRLATVRRSRLLPPTTIVDAIRVTSIEFTVLDVATTLGAGPLGDCVDEATMYRRLDLSLLADLLIERRCSHPAAVRMLHLVLAERLEEDEPTESLLELDLYRLLVEARVPGVEYQQPPPWWPEAPLRVDATIPAARLIIEADGRAWHSRYNDFERDRSRDNEAALNGWSVVRYTWKRLKEDRPAVLAELQALAARLQK